MYILIIVVNVAVSGASEHIEVKSIEFKSEVQCVFNAEHLKKHQSVKELYCTKK